MGQGLPHPGSFTICLECATWLRLDATMRHQRATEAEVFRLVLENPEADRMERTLRELHRKHGRPSERREKTS